MAGVAPVGIGSIGIPVVTENESHHLSFARRFKAVHSADRRYWPERGTWMEWRDPSDGRDPRVERSPNTKAGFGPRHRVGRWGPPEVVPNPHIRGALELASEILARSEWDRHKDPCALPSRDVIDVLTGERRIQRLSDYLTLRTGCDVAMRVSPQWSEFVLEECRVDREMAEALHLAVGSFAFGDNSHHRVGILCGYDGTGKSSFVEAVGAALGYYAHVLPPSTNRRTPGPPPWPLILAQLRPGARWEDRSA